MDGENRERQESPIPEQVKSEAEQPQMSEVGTLANIFLSPETLFEDLRRKTRFILAMVIVILSLSAGQIAFFEKVGFEKVMIAQLEKNSRIQRLPDDQKETIIKQQTQPFVKYIIYTTTPILLIIGLFIAGLLYWGAANAMGGKIGYFKSLSVFIYSTYAPWLIWSLANLLVLFLKNVDQIELGSASNGLVNANPNLFLDLKDSPALASLMGSIDLFTIWGLVLAAIGLQKIAKMSSGAAWAAVLIVQILLVVLKVGYIYLNA